MNRTKIKDLISDALLSIKYIEDDINDEDLEQIKSDLESLKDNIDDIQNGFEHYLDEVADIEDDLEGLVKRLSEVSK